MDHLFKPSVTVDSPVFRPFGAFGFELKSPAKWTKPMGERLCIIDLDNRPFDKANQIFGPKVMSWDNADELHGLSLGVLNHWLYGMLVLRQFVDPMLSRLKPSHFANFAMQPKSTGISTTTSRLTHPKTDARLG